MFDALWRLSEAKRGGHVSEMKRFRVEYLVRRMRIIIIGPQRDTGGGCRVGRSFGTDVSLITLQQSLISNQQPLITNH